MRRTIGLTACLLAFTGCVHTNAAVLDATVQLAPICPNGVKVYIDTASIGQPYQQIAILNSAGQTGSTTEGGMIHSQQQKAAALGANGIVVNGINEPKAGTKIIGALFGTGAERKGSAMAILIPGDSLRVQAACDGTKDRRARPT